MRMLIMLLFVTLLVMTVGCGDVKWSRWNARGEPAAITCYSGGVLIFKGQSTGKVKHMNNSYYFVDKADSRVKEVSGDCMFDYRHTP